MVQAASLPGLSNPDQVYADGQVEALADEILSDYASNNGFGAAVCSGLVALLIQVRDDAGVGQ